jgi:putative OPT family oligopeptide transporter
VADSPPPEAPDRLYEPAPGEAQLTLRAVLAGCLIGGVVAAMNTYVGLRIGWAFGGSLIAAILGFAFFSAVKPRSPFTVLETNITQTAGSAAGYMTAAAGLLGPIPALGMLGRKLSYLELTAWTASVAFIGVFFAVPLRRQMIAVEKLRFPTGTAAAQTILAMFEARGEAVGKARALAIAAVVSGAIALGIYFVPAIEHPVKPLILATSLAFLATWTVDLLLSPVMFGAGILIGPRVASSLLAGALFSWAVLGPLAQQQGWAPGAFMAYKDGARGWILWAGVAIMVADALTSLALTWRSVLNAFKRVEGEASDDLPKSEMIPDAWWIGGLAVSSVLTVAVNRIVFEIPIVLSIVAIVISSVLAMIATRAMGETDINPIGGMGKVTQLVYGALAPGQITTNLMAAGVTGAGATQAGDMMSDLKTGYLLRASPRRQFVAQCVGILAGIVVCVPVYKLFDRAYEIGGTDIPAPAAQAWKAMAELLASGLDALPDHALSAVAGGVAFGVIVPVLRATAPRLRPWLPSALAFGLAFIVPAYYSIAMFLGAMALVVWRRQSPASAETYGFALASGLLAGEGVMGVVNAVLKILGVDPLFPS